MLVTRNLGYIFILGLILEVFLIFQLITYLGWLGSIAFYILTSFLGQFMLRLLKRSSHPGSLGQSLVLLGCFLFLLPILLLKLIGLFFLIPGPRHLLILFFSGYLIAKISQMQTQAWYPTRPGGFRSHHPKEMENSSDIIDVNANRID